MNIYKKLNMHQPIVRLIIMIILMGMGFFINSMRENKSDIYELQKEYRKIMEDTRLDSID